MKLKNPFVWRKKNYAPESATTYKMVREIGNTFVSWDGNLYNSDIVRACIRPKIKALGKTSRYHMRTSYSSDKKSVSINPDPYMRFLLSDPNPYMTGQKLVERMETQLILNGNAFCLIVRNQDGFPVELFPIDCESAEAIFDKNGALSLKFLMPNGTMYQFSYDDIIHIKNDYNNNQVFGDSPAPCLMQIMDVVKTTDQGIINAIKNSSIVKWLLKFTSSMRDEDIKKKTKEFAENFLDVSNGTGVAATDAKAEAIQVKNDGYVPGADTIDKTTERIYAFFNTNKHIVQSDYTEDQWNAYYESEIEPDIIAFKEEFTRKLFSRKQRGFGNEIVFDSVALTTASMSTKLGLVQLVDRSIMNPNEVRAAFNLAPREGGDEFFLRLDTEAVKEGRDK